MSHRDDNAVRCLLSVFTGLFIFLFYYVAVNFGDFNAKGVIFGLNYNLVVYAASVLLAFALYCGGYFLLHRAALEDNRPWRTARYFIYALACVALLVFLYQCWTYNLGPTTDRNGSTIFFGLLNGAFSQGRVLQAYCTLAVVLFLSACLFFLASERGEVRSQRLRITLALVVSLVSAILVYAPNVFLGTEWGLWHSHAYMNSIINVAHWVPYDRINCSIYGHYGLIYLPFVKLLGDDTFAISLVISLFTFIAMACACYSASKIIKNDVLYGLTVLGLLSMLTTLLQLGQYFQNMPHRFLFPMLGLAYLVWQIEEKKEFNEKFIILDLLLGVLSITFNLETGVAVVSGVGAWRFCQTNMASKAGPLGYALGSFAGAYLLVAFYNLLVGGEDNSLLTFLYSYGAEAWRRRADVGLAALRFPLPNIHVGYIVYILVFLLPTCWSFCRVWKYEIHSAERKKLSVKMVLCVLGLAMLPYYMNRTAGGNVSLTIPCFLILAALCAEPLFSVERRMSWRTPEGLYASCVAITAFALTVSFAVDGVVHIDSAVAVRNKSVWETRALEVDMQNFRKMVPGPVPGAGLGVPELYYLLDWDQGVYLTDWSDMNRDSLVAVQEAMKGWGSFIGPKNWEKRLRGAEIAAEIRIGKEVFCLYQRKVK